MNSKDLAIGVLSTTAVVMLVGLIILNAQPQPAYASGMGDRGGDYIVVTGALWEQEELVYVFNTAENKMMVYRYDAQHNQIVARGPADMSRLLTGQSRTPSKKPAKRSRRNRP